MRWLPRKVAAGTFVSVGVTCLIAGAMNLGIVSNVHLGWTLLVVAALCVAGAYYEWYCRKDDATISQPTIQPPLFIDPASVRELTGAIRGAVLAIRAHIEALQRLPTGGIATGTKRQQIAWIAGTLLLGGAGLVFAVLHWSQLPHVAPITKPPIPIRPSVAVLGLRNNSGRPDAAWLATAIQEMLSTELGTGGDIRVASGDDVARAKADLSIREGDLLPETLQRLQNTLHVTSLILGSYTTIGEPESHRLQLDLQLVDAETKTITAKSHETGTDGHLFELVTSAAGELRRQAGLRRLSSAGANEVEVSLPSSREAARLYTEGLEKLRLLDAKGARDLLTEAAVVDPKHPLIHLALSAAHSALGYERLAVEEVQKSKDYSTGLGREQKLQIDARFYEAAHKWGKAVGAEKLLWKSFPDNLEYGLNLANAQISAQTPDKATNEALVTVDALRKLPFPLSEDGRIDLLESRARQEDSDFVNEKRLAVAAATKGRAIGARSMVGHARMLEATALLNLGDMDKMNAAMDEAQSIFSDLGDRGMVARAIELTASALDGTDYEGERKVLLKALDIHRAIGDKLSTARVLLNIGTALAWQDRTTEASKYFTQALTTFGEVNAEYAKAAALNQIGALMFYRGDLINAQKKYEQAFAIFNGLSEDSDTAATLVNIAEVLECRGQVEKASKKNQEALVLDEAARNKRGIAYDLFRAGENFTLRGEFVVARDRYNDALRLQDTIRSEKIPAADTRVALARLDIEEGRPADAERSASAADQILGAGKAADRSLWTSGVIADALLAQGKQKEAWDIADHASTLAAKTKNRRIRFAVAVTAARVRSATKKPEDVAEALRSLEATRAEASRTLFVISELEARLASGEIEIAAGRVGGKKRLAALAIEARARGFGRIAGRAAAAAS